MRPVDKGMSPYQTISAYADALPHLEKAIGCYCSYCEMPLAHVPEVEHKESKNSGGSLTDWNNLLLACKYCNTRKKEKIKQGEAAQAIWPDTDNTFLAYSYTHGVPALNRTVLSQYGSQVEGKARRLFEAVVLDNRPSSGDKDRRWSLRLEVFAVAREALQDWRIVKASEAAEAFERRIIGQAQAQGFFSIWMMVFADEPEIKNALIAAFPGTARRCFDAEGAPLHRSGGSI